MRAVIVTGTRKYSNYEKFCDFVWDLKNVCFAGRQCGIPEVLIEGEGCGIDQLAARWAKDKNISCIPVPAQWKKHGKSAGPKRNYWMLDILLSLERAGYEVSVWAFPAPDSKGTRHMMKIAEAAGVQVVDATDHSMWKYEEFES